MLLIRYKEGQFHLIDLVNNTLRKIRLLAFIALCFLFTSQANASCWFFCDLCGEFWSLTSTVHPLHLSTTPTANTSSYAKPQVRVTYKGCISFTKVSDNSGFIVGVGPYPETHHDYHYYGGITMNSDVCSNNPYCPTGTKYTGSALDHSVCSFYKNMCKQPIPDSSGATQTGKFLGMCAYQTEKPAWLSAITDNIGPFFKDVAGGILTVLGGPVGGTIIALKWSWDQIPVKIHGYGPPLGCVPIPVAPMPPPYGVPKGSLYVQAPKVNQICDLSHYVNGDFSPPTVIKDTSEQHVCVPPKTKKSSSSYSTFDKACLRVSYDNIIKTCSGPASGTPDFVSSTKGINPAVPVTVANQGPRQNNEFPALYASGDMASCPPTCSDASGCEIAPSDTSKFIPRANILDGGSSAPAQFAGYNLAAFADICYDFTKAENGQDITTNQVKLTDIYSNERTLKVIPGCKDPAINGDKECGDQKSIYYNETKICLYEPPVSGSGLGAYFGCVNRPSMAQPEISFCDQENTYSSTCIKITPPGQASCTITYNYNKQTKSYDHTNTCRTGESMPISAILTDNCLNYPYHAMPNLFQSYKKRTDSCAPCTNNSSPQPNKNSIGLYYKTDPKNIAEYVYQRGASRMCVSVLSPPLAPSRSPVTCAKDCNDICIPVPANQQGSSNQQNPGLCSRSNPLPSVLSPLPKSTFCQNPTSSERTRGRYPIEDGLCADVLLFDFADCSTIKNTQYKNACNAFATKCKTHCIGGANSLHKQCVSGTANACNDLVSNCLLPNLSDNCSTLKTQCSQGNKTSCNNLKTSNCLLPNAYAYLDSCNNIYSQCLDHKGSIAPSNDCYYIKQNKQYIPNTPPPPMPSTCPAHWIGNSPCANKPSTFYNNGTVVSNPAKANAVECGGVKYCCDKNPASQSGDVCSPHLSPNPQPSGMCPYKWSGPGACSGEGFVPLLGFLDKNGSYTSQSSAAAVHCCMKVDSNGNCISFKQVCCNASQPGGDGSPLSSCVTGSCQGKGDPKSCNGKGHQWKLFDSGWCANWTNYLCNAASGNAFMHYLNKQNSASSPSNANGALCCNSFKQDGSTKCNNTQNFCCGTSGYDKTCPDKVNPDARAN